VFHDETHKTMVDKISVVVDNQFRKAGKVIVLDNYYICLSIVEWILQHDMHIIGTVQSNRIPVPNWTLSAKAP
jgi:hypothetical protein